LKTPREAGFWMPAEWQPHACCWMAWPCRPENWQDMEKARDTVARVARAIARFEPVTMTANGADLRGARRALDGTPQVDVVEVPSDDSWARDTAPTFLTSERHESAGVDWRFNAYGGIYADYGRTANMARRILDLAGARRFAAPIVLEGGAVHTDGGGTLLTTEDVVLDPRRNPGLSKGDAEEVLRQYLGVDHVIWLRGALEHDNTGGHVDNLACFAGPGVVVATGCDDPQDPQYEAVQANLQVLRAARDARGRALEVVELPQPARPLRDGRRLSPSYVNFYLADGAVILPAFGDPRDDEARDIAARLFPDRRVVPVATMALAEADGNVHCITQQQPAV
jgi:agmatine deiminase